MKKQKAANPNNAAYGAPQGLGADDLSKRGRCG